VGTKLKVKHQKPELLKISNKNVQFFKVSSLFMCRKLIFKKQKKIKIKFKGLPS
jgi:hypothetical protein